MHTTKHLIQNIFINCFLLLYLYSGIETFTKENKIKQKIIRLSQNSGNINQSLSEFLIVITNLLLILFSLSLGILTWMEEDWSKKIRNYILYPGLILFMIIVTMVYYLRKTIPFLTNLSLVCGLSYFLLDSIYS
jgi:uncharacterized BrkB/YihY/UPF0761 family membrane protein